MHVRNLFNHKNVKPNDVTNSLNHCVDFLQVNRSSSLKSSAVKEYNSLNK